MLLSCLQPLNRVVLACALFSFFSSGIIQFGLMSCTLTTVQKHFDVSYTLMAVAITCFQLAQIVFSFIAPHIEHRWPDLPAEMISGLGMVLSVLGSLMYGNAVGYWMLIVAQLINGVGAACVYIYMPSMFARLAAGPAVLSLAIAKSFTLTPIGIVVASVSCNQAVENWRYLYIGYGMCLFIPAAVFIYIAVSYRTHDPRHTLRSPPTFAEVRGAIFQDAKTLLAVAGVTCTAFVVAGLSTFLAAYVEEHLGQTKENASLVLAATVPAVAIGTIVGGKVSSSLGWTHRKLLIFVACASAATFVDFLVVLPGDVRLLWLNIIVLVIAMFCLFLQAGPAVAVVAQMLPRYMVSHGQSFLNIITRAIGGILGPIMVAVILDQGVPYNMAFFIVSWMLVLGCVTFGASALLTPTDITIDHGVAEEPEGGEASGEDFTPSREHAPAFTVDATVHADEAANQPPPANGSTNVPFGSVSVEDAHPSATATDSARSQQSDSNDQPTTQPVQPTFEAEEEDNTAVEEMTDVAIDLEEGYTPMVPDAENGLSSNGNTASNKKGMKKKPEPCVVTDYDGENPDLDDDRR